MNEFTVSTSRRFFGSFMCLVLGCIVTNIAASDHYFPRFASMISFQGNPLITGCVAFIAWTIGAILWSATWPQILLTVIQSIAIPVIHIARIIIGETGNDSVHEDGCFHSIFDYCSCGIKFRLIRTSSLYAPIPLTKPREVPRINGGTPSSCQWNQFDRLILRLDDSVPFHVVLLHNLSEKEIVRRLAASFSASRIPYGRGEAY